MVEWYHHVLGMRVVLRCDPDVATTFVTQDEAHHRGAFFSPPGVTDDPSRASHTRVHHLAYEYESVDELLATWQRLKELQIAPVDTVCHGPSFAFYYRDPDGNIVELLADAYGDRGLSHRHMETEPAMKTNPRGARVDPDELVEARNDGVELDELRTRALAGGFTRSP